jgi:hypothetical protein
MRRLERVAGLALLALLAGGLTAHADPVDLQPYKATYTAEWKGITAAGSTMELKKTGADSYVFSSVSSARGIFRIAFSETLTQASTFRVIDGKVIPSTFTGSDEKERPINLTFDWPHKRVTGVAKGHDVDLELPDGAQDPMSLQIASLRNLAASQLQDKVSLVDSDKVKEYKLQREGTARIETALGTLDTVIYTSTNSDGDRITRTWVAPALGYLPVRAERLHGAKLEFTLLIQTVEH